MNTISSLLSVTGLYGVQGVVGSNPTVPTIYVNESNYLTVVGFFAFWHIKNKSNINQKPLTPYRGIRTLAPIRTATASRVIVVACAIVGGLDRTWKA